MLLTGHTAPEKYRTLLQEDRLVEWSTVCLFLAAGVIVFGRALRQRRLFDGLVGLFCLFVAGEEFSWGQRLVGYYPPEFFLGHNYQQEFNLHNLPQAILQPKWVLMAVLGCYGVLLPIAWRFRPLRAAMIRVGATPPPLGVSPWFAAAVALLLWYPLTLTGEWVEALAGALFVFTARIPAKSSWIVVGLAIVSGAAMTRITDAVERGRDGGRIACAAAETRALLGDIASGQGGTPKLWRMRRVHKRLWSTIEAQYLDEGGLRAYRGVACDAAGDLREIRRKYGLDPWGSPYWLLVEKIAPDERSLSVYSFGPNRRRDTAAASIDGGVAADDIVASRARVTVDPAGALRQARH